RCKQCFPVHGGDGISRSRPRQECRPLRGGFCQKMIRKHYDKILMGLSLALLLGVFALAAFRPEPKSITEYVNIPVLRPNNTYEVTPMVEPDLSVPQWEEPVAQSAGVEWVFDVFTPPVIYFNPQTETFT